MKMAYIKGTYPDEVIYPEFNFDEFRKEYEAFCMKNRLNTHKKPYKPYELKPYEPAYTVNYKILPDTYYEIPKIKRELYLFSLKCPQRPLIAEYEPAGVMTDERWLDKAYDNLSKAERKLELILNGGFDYNSMKYMPGSSNREEIRSIRYRLKMIEHYRTLLGEYKVRIEEFRFDYNKIENRLNEVIRKHTEQHFGNIVTDKFIREEVHRQEVYENRYEEYLIRKKEYDENMLKWGPDDFTVKDYLIFRYVRPLFDDTDEIVLSNGELYKFPKWVHFVQTKDFVFDVNRGKMEHQASYRKFLELNSHIRRNGSDVRAIDPWTYGQFTEAWVINHFTGMFSLEFLNR
jgi:hypothetical protein